jgi:hypothetical protein
MRQPGPTRYNLNSVLHGRVYSQSFVASTSPVVCRLVLCTVRTLPYCCSGHRLVKWTTNLNNKDLPEQRLDNRLSNQTVKDISKDIVGARDTTLSALGHVPRDIEKGFKAAE